MSQPELIEGIHFYINKDGYIVLTEKYHLEKGSCCGMGCLHCPYNYENVPETPKPLAKGIPLGKGGLEDSSLK